MIRRTASIQFLALATVVLTQALGACLCIAAEAACGPITCVTVSTAELQESSGCCDDQPDSEESASCCLGHDSGWDLLPATSGIAVTEPTYSISCDTDFTIGWDNTDGAGFSLSRLERSRPQPPNRLVQALFGVWLN